MFSYTPISAQEALEERYNLLKDGVYDAVIAASIDKQSSSNNPMMEITLQVFDENGKSREVKDYIVFTKSMMWKVIQFAESAGLLNQYEQGTLCSEAALGNRLTVKIGVEQGGLIPQDRLKDKAPGSKYPDKNKVIEYVKRGEEKVEDDPFCDDDLPNF
jgi:hypothetical protein